MRRYQIVMKPIATATGEPAKWSFVAHGARYDRPEALATVERLKSNGYETKLLPVN